MLQDYVNYPNQNSTSNATGWSRTTAREDNLSYFIVGTPIFDDLVPEKNEKEIAIDEPAIQDVFKELLAKWESETIFESDVERILSNENFIKLLLLGDDIIPYVLNEIEKGPSPTVWLLHYLKKGEIDPNISLESARVKWLEWGKSNGFI